MTLPADGLVIIDKEAGWTSFDVVARLRRILGTRRVGHTGTLDPAATGVLPVLYGRGTRLAELLMEHDKEYLVRCRLGVTTDTQDMTGTVLERREVSCSPGEVRAAALSFLGEQLQLPPMYSALKVGGKRLYELARAGEEVKREPRPVTCYAIEVKEVSLPLAELRVHCSRGTYIRTLCHDLGERLGCGAAMESLRRSRSGDFSLQEAHTLQEVALAGEEGRLGEWIWSLDRLLSAYPRLEVKPEHERLLRNGNRIPGEDYGAPEGERVRMCLPGGELIGLYGYREREKEYYPVRMLGQ